MNITPIIEAVFALVAVVITVIVIPYINSKTTKEQQKQLNGWIKIAVAAAEQIYTGAGRGAEKKEYVLSYLAEHGMVVDVEKIDAMIEAAVYELNNGLFITTEGEADA